MSCGALVESRLMIDVKCKRSHYFHVKNCDRWCVYRREMIVDEEFSLKMVKCILIAHRA